MAVSLIVGVDSLKKKARQSSRENAILQNRFFTLNFAFPLSSTFRKGGLVLVWRRRRRGWGGGWGGHGGMD